MHKIGKLAWMWPQCPLGRREFLHVLLKDDFSFEILVPNMYLNGHMQVRVYDLAAMSCSYVLAGHTETILCLDTCVSSSGRALIVTGSKDNNVSSIFFF